MRFSVFYNLRDEFLPLDYRNGFLSLIKEAIKNSTQPALMKKYYSSHTLKPYTFSVYFPELGREKTNGSIQVGKKAIFNFSTSSMELATHLYNGFLKIKSFPIFRNEINFEKIQLRHSSKIRSEFVIFRTISPILVNNLGSSEWFLLPGEKGFLDSLNFSINEMSKVFLNKTEVNFEFKPKFFRRKVVRHYNTYMSGFTGTFEIKSDPEMLQLIYDIGLGVRRGQGFGMLEVVSQK